MNTPTVVNDLKFQKKWKKIYGVEVFMFDGPTSVKLC